MATKKKAAKKEAKLKQQIELQRELNDIENQFNAYELPRLKSLQETQLRLAALAKDANVEAKKKLQLRANEFEYQLDAFKITKQQNIELAKSKTIEDQRLQYAQRQGIDDKAQSELKKLGLTRDQKRKAIEQGVTLELKEREKVTAKPVDASIVNGFYIPLELQINQMKADKMPAKQWIEKFAKGEEAKWTGLTDWLSSQTGSVSKADIQNYLDDNRIEVTEVVKSSEISDEEIDTLLNDEVGEGMTRSEAREFLENEERKDDTKFSAYQLEGEKEKYKEVLVTMPRKTGRFDILDENGDIYNTVDTKEEANKIVSGYGKLAGRSLSIRENNERLFKSSHFEEPNILVHLRMNTRTDAKGNKVLFLEEVQSDWGQEGKRRGFEKPKDTKAIKELENEKQKVLNSSKSYQLLNENTEGDLSVEVFDAIQQIATNMIDNQYSTKESKKERFLKDIKDTLFYWEKYEYVVPNMNQKELSNFYDVYIKELENNSKKKSGYSASYRLASVENKLSDINTKIFNLSAKEGVKKAPFVMDTNAWTKLGLKVALKEAVAQGADKIAWTTGEQQNDRYSLEKQVDEVTYSKKADGSYVIAAAKDGQEVFKNENVAEKNLEDYVGKDVAKKIIENEGNPNIDVKTGKTNSTSISGQDLKVGGKGMIGFYGSPTEGSLGIVGNVAKSLFKQEPKTVKIEIDNNAKDAFVVVRKTPNKRYYAEITGGGYSKVLVDYKTEEGYFDSKEEALEYGNKIKKEIIGSQQNSIDITPELKAQVEEGLPQFSKGGRDIQSLADIITETQEKGQLDDNEIAETLEASYSKEEIQEAFDYINNPPEDAPAPAKGKMKERSLTKQFLKENPSLQLSEGAINYEEISNKSTVEEVNNLINELGLDASVYAVDDWKNGMNLRVRFTMAQILIKKLSKEGRLDEANDLRERLVVAATEAGQGIQAFAMFPALTAEGELRKMLKMINNINKKREKADRKLTKIKEEFKQANEDAINEAVENLGGKPSEKRKKAARTYADYGTKNKVITKAKYEEMKKALANKAFSAAIPVQLIPIGVYHLEAGSRKFKEFSEALIEDFGDKVKPYLAGLYKKAAQELGLSASEIDSDATISQENKDRRAREAKKSIKGALKDLGLSISKIAIEHYTVVDSAKRTLVEKIMAETELTENEAKEYAKAIEEEFDRLATEKKKKILDTVFNPRERKKPALKNLESELLKLTNLGAFKEQDLVEAYADKMGWAKLSQEEISEIERLASIVEESPEGIKRAQAVEDLLGYEAKIKGIPLMDVVTSIWYANVLSGFTTQLVNFIANATQLLFSYGETAIRNPRTGAFMARGIIDGVNRGILEAGSSLKTGYNPIRGRVEIPSTLELKTFKGGKYNPANYLKYVRRLMVASDVIMFEAQKEMRAYQWARMLAANENKLDPTVSIKQRALDILHANDSTIPDAKVKAAEEAQTEIDAVNAENISSSEKAKKIRNIKTNEKRRAFELVQESRGSEIMDESNAYASWNTFNHPASGLLGAVAKRVNQLIETNGVTKIFRFVVPFTNVIANVANMGINYTPWGYIRAARQGSVFGIPKAEWDSMSKMQQDQYRVELVTKATVGLAMSAAVLMLTLKGDDDDEPLLEITANATGKYKKNEGLKEDGWQPYSFRVYNKKTKEYGDWISYQYSPLLVMFSLIGNLKDYDKYRKENTDENLLDKLSFAAIGASRTFLDGTFLMSINSFLKALTETEAGDAVDDAMKSIFKTVKGFVLPALYTQAAREVQIVFDIPEKEVGTSLIAELVRDIPVARNMLNDRVNIWGQRSIADTDKFTSKSEDTDLTTTLTSKKIFLTRPNVKTTNIIDIESGKFRAMTDNEFFNYAEERGKYLYETLIDRLEDIKEMSNEDAQKEVNSIVSDASKLAEAKSSLPIESYDRLKREMRNQYREKKDESKAKKEEKSSEERGAKVTPEYKKEIENIKKNDVSQISRFIVSKIKQSGTKSREIQKLLATEKLTDEYVDMVSSAVNKILKQQEAVKPTTK